MQSRSLIAKLGLSDKISVVYANGADFDYKDYSSVVIASLVPNKDETITRIRETAQDDVLVAVRSAERLHTLLYNPVDEQTQVMKQCDYVSKTDHDPRVINTTLFYTASPFAASIKAVAAIAVEKKSCGNCNRCKCTPKF